MDAENRASIGRIIGLFHSGNEWTLEPHLPDHVHGCRLPKTNRRNVGAHVRGGVDSRPVSRPVWQGLRWARPVKYTARSHRMSDRLVFLPGLLQTCQSGYANEHDLACRLFSSFNHVSLRESPSQNYSSTDDTLRSTSGRA